MAPASHPSILAEGLLPDGRILQVEGITYGAENRIGQGSPILEHFGPWLPPKLRKFLQPKNPLDKLHLGEPALVVWVSAIDSNSGTNIDCQSIRVEFVGADGELYGEKTSSWSGRENFWRVGHIFDIYPRDSAKLVFQASLWRKQGTNAPLRMELPNPHIVQPAIWKGAPLPQKQIVGGVEIVLRELQERTNGASNQYWQTPGRYWEPRWELRRNGQLLSGWDDAEWTAEDPVGNHGRQLGVNQPVQQYSAKFYPSATNLEAATLLATLPTVTLADFTNETIWNVKTKFGSSEVAALGLFPAGVHHFLDGKFVANPPKEARMGPTRGGSPSGWVGISIRTSPTHLDHWNGHYTPGAVIYLHTSAPAVGDPVTGERLAIRLRDEQGHYYIAEPESQGGAGEILPFLIHLPADVKNVVPEIVVLKPVSASFTVNTPASAASNRK